MRTADQIAFDKRRVVMDDLPSTINIETVVGCNLRCPMCPVHDQASLMGRPVTLMRDGIYDSILHQVSDRPRTVWLNVIGEPTLHPKLASFVERAKVKGHSVGFATNGTRMSRELSHRLAALKVDQVVFSIDGFSKETYEKIRLRGRYEQVVENVLYYAAVKKRENPGSIMRVDCIESDATRPELGEFKAFWSRHADEVVVLPLDNWTGQLILPEFLGKRTSIRRSFLMRYPCHLLWTSLYISAEGRLMLCCHDFKFLSNLSQVGADNLKELFNTEVARYRREHTSGEYSSPCQKCDAWKTMPKRYEESALSRMADKLEQGVAQRLDLLARR